METIYLVRHCKAEGQAPEAPLTREGREQAERLAAWLADKGIGRIVCSPYARAVDTIRPFAERTGLAIHRDARLKERILSAVELPDWMAKLESTYADDQLRYEGGESSGEAAARGNRVVDELLERPEAAAVLVTHGALLSLLIRRYDPSFGFREWLALANPDVYQITVRGPVSIRRVDLPPNQSLRTDS